MMDEFTLTLNSPLTEEQWDMITDIDFDHTDNITFHTKHGKEVEFVKKKTGWTPCSERLPEEEGLYFVTDHKGDVVRYCFKKTDSSKEYWMRCVKAWMPLPEPYDERNMKQRMTKAKAIYILKNTAWLGNDEDRERTEEAVQMAVDALSEKKTGRWMHERLSSTTGGTYPITRCSICQNVMPFESEPPYCPSCGAKMEVKYE